MGKIFTALKKSKYSGGGRDKKKPVAPSPRAPRPRKKIERKAAGVLPDSAPSDVAAVPDGPVVPDPSSKLVTTALPDASAVPDVSALPDVSAVSDTPPRSHAPSRSAAFSPVDTPPDVDSASGLLEIREPHKSLIAYNKPHSPEAEQFRMLKTAILFPDKGEPPRTIMITSSAAGEGKSFVAANLAVTMANSIDEYVLLMDCDLRRPTIHKIFGLPDNTPGLTEYLTRGTPLPHLLKKIMLEKLSILPCGTPPPNPSELLSSEQMRKLLQEVKTRYQDRYIIIDSPPPYVTAEANALARQVDAIVIVVKTGYSKKSDLKDLVDTYGREKILGVVKNYADKVKNYTYG